MKSLTLGKRPITTAAISIAKPGAENARNRPQGLAAKLRSDEANSDSHEHVIQSVNRHADALQERLGGHALGVMSLSKRWQSQKGYQQ